VKGIVCAIALWSGAAAGQALNAPQRTSIDDAIVRESDPGAAAQMTTAELREVLARRDAVVLDARPAEEFGMSHIPGAVNVSQKPGTPMSLYISDVAEVMRLVGDRGRLLVVYCNGPFCGKSRRFAAELVEAGYRNVRRYQLGMPGWRTMGGVAAIDAAAIRRVAELDRTAVFVDAGLERALPLPGLIALRAQEVTRAKDDGRLPMTDHNTRIIVIAASGDRARMVAEAIAVNAFHNVAYYEGRGEELQQPSRHDP
jgi:rhodanese-related sulfurtransferase